MLSSATVVSVGAAGWIVHWSATVAWSAWAALSTSGGNLGDTDDRLVERVVVLICAATLAVVLTWLLVGLLVCSVDIVLATGAGAETASVTRPGLLRPRLARALVSAVAGAAVASGHPAAAGDDRTSHLPHRLEGLAVPERPYGGVRTHRVGADESLWSITADLLAARTGSQESGPARSPVTHQAISRVWPRLHRLNRDRLGDNPHLIHPGTKLRLPAWATVPTRGAIR